MTRLSSKAYLAGSKGQQCTLRIVGVCNGDPATVVPAHIRDRHKGGGTKASDISVANGCSACHAKLDGQLCAPLPEVEWLAYALRGLQETLEQRIEAGLLGFPHDPPKTRKTKSRKPAEARAKIQPNSRPIKSRGFSQQKRGFRP